MKKKHPEHVNLERWLISYADFITLLFAFFVVMYAMANQDKAQIQQVTESIEKAFFGASGKIDTGTGKELNIMTSRSTMGGKLISQEMGHTNATPVKTPELEEIARRIEDSLAYQLRTTDLKDRLQLIYDDRGLVVRIAASDLYDPGVANVREEHLPLIDKIASIIIDTDRLIRIEGHTDNIAPSRSGRYPTNWELSSARATWIIRYLIAKFSVPMRRLSAAGYADGNPVADNDTPEGRAKNRRIEIVIQNLK